MTTITASSSTAPSSPTASDAGHGADSTDAAEAFGALVMAALANAPSRQGAPASTSSGSSKGSGSAVEVVAGVDAAGAPSTGAPSTGALSTGALSAAAPGDSQAGHVAIDSPTGLPLPATAGTDNTIAGGVVVSQLAADPSGVLEAASGASAPNSAQAVVAIDVSTQSTATTTEPHAVVAQAIATVANGSAIAPASAPPGEMGAAPRDDPGSDAPSVAAAEKPASGSAAASTSATLTAADDVSQIQASAVSLINRHGTSQALDTAPAAAPQPGDKDSSASSDGANAFDASQTSAVATAPAPMRQGAVPAPQTAPAAPPTPPQPSVPTQIAGLVAPLRTAADGNYTVSLQLHPAELGPVSVQVSVDQGVLSVQMYADHPQAHDALRASLSDLRGQLQAAGIQTGTVDVGVRIAAAQQGGQANTQGNSGFAGQQSWQQGNSGQQLHQGMDQQGMDQQGMHQQSGHGAHAEPQTGWAFDDAFGDADGTRPRETPSLQISGRRRATYADDRAVDVRM